MLRLQEPSQPVLQAPSFPGVENPTVILARMYRDKTGRVKASSLAPTDPHRAAMLTAEASSRAQVRRLVETVALQPLGVTAIPEKRKVIANRISRKVRKWKQQNPFFGGKPASSYSSLSVDVVSANIWTLSPNAKVVIPNIALIFIESPLFALAHTQDFLGL